MSVADEQWESEVILTFLHGEGRVISTTDGQESRQTCYSQDSSFTCEHSAIAASAENYPSTIGKEVEREPTSKLQ
jgi:hypothetical protein